MLVCAESRSLTLFSAMNEASFEGALLGSLDVFRQMWILHGKSLPKDVDRKLKAKYAAESDSNPRYFSLRRTAPSVIRVAQWAKASPKERARARAKVRATRAKVKAKAKTISLRTTRPRSQTASVSLVANLDILPKRVSE